MSRCRRSWISHLRTALAQEGIETVRTRPCLPARSTIAQRPSRLRHVSKLRPPPNSPLRNPHPNSTRSLRPFFLVGAGAARNCWACADSQAGGSGNAADGGEIGRALGPLHGNLKHWEYHPDRAGKEAHTSPVLYFFESDDSHTWEFVALMPFRCCYLDWLYFTGIRTDRLAFPVAVALIPVTAR